MRTALGVLVVACVTGCAAVAPELDRDHGSPVRSLGAVWHNVALPGKVRTAYTEITQNGRPLVYAESTGSASMLRRRLNIEASHLGRVGFSWRVPELIPDADLSDRDASDSPASLILAFDGDHGKLSLRNRMLFELAHALTGETPPFATLMYVWDNKMPVRAGSGEIGRAHV